MMGLDGLVSEADSNKMITGPLQRVLTGNVVIAVSTTQSNRYIVHLSHALGRVYSIPAVKVFASHFTPFGKWESVRILSFLPHSFVSFRSWESEY